MGPSLLLEVQQICIQMASLIKKGDVTYCLFSFTVDSSTVRMCHSYSVLSPCTVHEISEVLNLLEWMVIGVYLWIEKHAYI